MYPTIYFRIRVTDDEQHCIFVQDFDAFEDCVLQLCMAHLGEIQSFAISFDPVNDDDEEIPF